MKSHRLPEFDVDFVYDQVRNNLLYFLATLLKSSGSCIDKALYDLAKKRTRMAKVASFFARCDENYVAKSILLLDKYVPSKTKQRFLDSIFARYRTIVRPWIIRELRKKRPKVRLVRKEDRKTRDELLIACAFFVDAVTPLLRYKDTCIAEEVHNILSVSKSMELMFLKRVRSRKVYSLLSSRVPLLGTIAQHKDASNNIRYSTCRNDDQHIKEFAMEVLDIVMHDPVDLQRRLINAIGRI